MIPTQIVLKVRLRVSDCGFLGFVPMMVWWLCLQGVFDGADLRVADSFGLAGAAGLFVEMLGVAPDQCDPVPVRVCGGLVAVTFKITKAYKFLFDFRI